MLEESVCVYVSPISLRFHPIKGETRKGKEERGSATRAALRQRR